MNKKYVVLLLLILMVFCFVGCGKKDQESDVIAQGEISLSGEDKEYEVLDDETESLEEIPEEQVISFECLDEIREALPESGLVQIDDMLFQYGCKVSEAIEIIENSQSTFEYYEDYNENELVLPGDSSRQIILLKGNNWYFQLKAENLSDETISLKDCTVTWIKTEKASKGNVFYAGFNDENNNCVMYDYIKEIMSDYEIISERSETDSENNRQIITTYFVTSDVSPDGHFRIHFIFDSTTGELKELEISWA